jgi:hypothetical protein
MLQWTGDRTRGSTLSSTSVAVLLILMAAVATRIVGWWNPVAHPDDQFYLLAGEQILRGQWPYVDVWDRKPLGLFLIYAGIASIGGGSILGLNLVATAFAAATAVVVRQTGLLFASARGATMGAIAYLIAIALVGGQNGQSPVFYNLFMAGAAWLLLASAIAGDAGRSVRFALIAMLLCGLSMTVKQVSFIEGGYFGLAFLWLMMRQGIGSLRLAAIAAGMIGLALLPTALTFGGYAIAGPDAFDAYFQASFVSIFEKTGWGWKAKLAGVGFFLLHCTPLLIMALLGIKDRSGEPRSDLRGALLAGWIIAAFIGYGSVPHFFDHYALPLIAPLAISASTFFDRKSGPLFFAGLAAFSLILPPIRDVAKHRASAAEFRRLEVVVDKARQGGCIYLADGPTRLYSTIPACRLTRYLFPDHLNLMTEAPAVGVDTRVELRRILELGPAVVLTQDVERKKHNPETDRLLYGYLNRRYRVVYRSSDDLPRPVESVRVWQRRDLKS